MPTLLVTCVALGLLSSFDLDPPGSTHSRGQQSPFKVAESGYPEYLSHGEG